MKDHSLRQRALAEIHARPFEAYETPRAVFHQAFMAPPSDGQNRSVFSDWCVAHDALPPDPIARHHVVELPSGIRVVWERHHEFITMTWDCLLADDSTKDLALFAKENENGMLAPGAQLISLAQLEILKTTSRKNSIPKGFDVMKTCASSINNDEVVIVSDFQQLENGATRIVVHNRGIDGHAMGAVVRRILEVETYRVLSLLGFVFAKQTMPAVSEIENRLMDLIGEMEATGDIESSRSLLKTITKLATNLEKISASSQFRISATKAYYNLVILRLSRLQGLPYKDMMSIDDFLGRRLAPAMRTCDSVESRISIASKKLSRAANLLRTKVDIQLEAQNHTLLNSMDRRAKQQFRLQQTVEGLSIAAISYYIVSLIGYIAKGSQYVTGIEPGLITALSVPIVLLVIWLMVRKIRISHSE